MAKVEIRNKVLRAFEQAEAEEDVGRHPDLLTFVLIGGGPIGVEMALPSSYAIAGLGFRRINPRSARILVDAAPRKHQIHVVVGMAILRVDRHGS